MSETSNKTIVIKRKVIKKKNSEVQGDCPVCMDHFTSVIRQPIKCQYCSHQVCRVCTSTYLTTNLNDPHCMGCKREWNREFIDTNLTQTFRKGPLKIHRRKVLIDRERGRLPAMQVYVEALHNMNEISKRISVIRKLRHELKSKRLKIQHEFSTESLTELAIRCREVNQELQELKNEKLRLEERYHQAYFIYTGREHTTRQFIMKCPAEECRGFLSTAWKCGTCQKSFCADCHLEKNGTRDEDHICNEDAKATASMIQTETRPCPKCGIRISKIDGCDQMWCTSCQTTFSWNTGQILLNTVVHNPHYYEYLRRTNNGAIPREAGDVPCGGLPGNWQFTRIVMDHLTLTNENKILMIDIHRLLADIQHVRLRQFPLRAEAGANRDYDIRYLQNNMTEEEWGTALERTETKSERNREIGLILQTVLHVGSEKITGIVNSDRTHERSQLAKKFVEEMECLRMYSNQSLWQKGIQMGIVVPIISKQWNITWARKADMKLNTEYMDVSPVAPTTVTEPVAPVDAEEIRREIDTQPGTTAAEILENEDLRRRRERRAKPSTATDEVTQNDFTIMVEVENGEFMEMRYSDAMKLMAQNKQRR